MKLLITFRDLPHSDAVEAHVAKCAAKLPRLYARIVACRVVVEAPHRRHLHGKRYHCRIDLIVPGDELVVGRTAPENLVQEDLHAAIDRAFADAARLVSEHVARLRTRRRTARAG